MQRYLLRRLLTTIPVLAVVAVITFSLLRLAPGDPAAVLLGDYATSESLARMRQALGLDKPIYQQFVIWIGNALRGDLGDSLFLGRSVVRSISERLEATLSLAILAELLAIVIGVPLGTLAAWRAHTWIDRTAMFFAVLGFSLPVFWLGINFILLFGVALRLLPAQGYRDISEGLVPWLRHLILPVITLGLISSAIITRMTRSSVLEILREDYIRTARAKGLGERIVLTRHALKAASTPIVTVIGLSFAGLVAGVVITETVFNIPGVGRLIVGAVLSRDYPVIQGTILMVAALYVFINLVVDIMYAYLDPRVKY